MLTPPWYPTARPRSGRLFAGLVACALSVGIAAPAGAGPIGTTEVASGPGGGGPSNGAATQTMISRDAKVVAFQSTATNLVPGPTKGSQIYARSKGADGRPVVERISTSSNEVEGNSKSDLLAVSATGRFVVFRSQASNLVLGDADTQWDTFIRDRQFGITQIISVNSQGKQSSSVKEEYLTSKAGVTPDGRYVVFEAYGTDLDPVANNPDRPSVFLRDRIAGTTKVMSATPGGINGNEGSRRASISDDGKVVSFDSVATNLVPGDTNGASDIFVRDLLWNTLTRVSVTSKGVQANGYNFLPDLSADGRRVLFQSEATNLVPSDTNAMYDAFVRNLATGTTTRVSLTSKNTQIDGFAIQGVNHAELSADGKTVLFSTKSVGVVPDQPVCLCTYRHGVDVGGEITSLAGVSWNGKGVADPTQGGWWAYDPSGDAKAVAFLGADGLTSDDTNGLVDVGVRTIG